MKPHNDWTVSFSVVEPSVVLDVDIISVGEVVLEIKTYIGVCYESVDERPGAINTRTPPSICSISSSKMEAGLIRSAHVHRNVYLL